MDPRGGKAAGVPLGDTLERFAWKMSSRKELRHDVVKLASGAGSRACPAHTTAGPVEGGKPTPLTLTAWSMWLVPNRNQKADNGFHVCISAYTFSFLTFQDFPLT